MALSLSFLDMAASTSTFVQYRDGSSNWVVGHLAADRLSAFFAVMLSRLAQLLVEPMWRLGLAWSDY